ncbi:MAG: outer membrane protein assembly factor BamA [Desulfobacula sp.]|nr:outer membrane protein assembly factor BamA [Desulfobacula sp.]
MKTSFLKKAFTYSVLFFLLFACDLFADTNVKIAIFPFSISANKPNQQIQEKIKQMIAENLEKEGATVIFPEGQPDINDWGITRFKTYGIQAGVDYILTGSLFVAGEAISIDSRLIHIYEQNGAIPFFTEANSFENLFSSVSQFSKEIIGELYQKQIITDIAVAGNKRIEKDAVLRILDTHTGDIFKPENVSKDLKKIYDMGYFDDVLVEKESHDKGVKIVFKVVEKPSIREIRFKKNKVYETEELMESINIKTGSILNVHTLNSNVDRLRLLYTEKNYHNCSITYEIIPLEHSQADILFIIEEGEKIRVEKISFEGNTYFSDKKLKKAMNTSEKGIFSFFTSSGDLNETEVKNDVVKIESLYKNNGFIDAKVSDPDIEIGKEYISIHFKIEEGAQYKIKKIDFSGDLILTKEEILKKIKSKEGELYNREEIRNDMNYIADLYSQQGFANVQINPLIDKIENEHLMTVDYSINKGAPVYFRNVNISGNSKTRDKVIRRELKVVEQDLYNKENIEKSFKNLNRLDYFSELEIIPVKTEEENLMDLNVKVADKDTGTFSFGGGFSSEDGPFGMVSLQERNLFGRGQTGKISAKVSGSSALYDISFFEPYIMDTPVSGGFSLYKEDKEYEYYDKEAIGMTLMLGYKLFDYTKIGVNYNIEDFTIADVESAYTNMTPGSFLTSSIKPYIVYDSRNDIFLPTEGFKHSFSVEYAGEFLGGEIDYTKYLAETTAYFPLFWKFTGALHAEGGYLDDRSGDTINIDYAMFYLGGMNSLRGFDKFDISGMRAGDTKERGGEKYVQFNAEITFPLTDKYKLAGVFFYDRGDVYRTSEDFDFGDQFSSIGTGIRWNSPLGPLRIEYGWVIDGKNIKESGDGEFAFSVGASF